MNRVGAAVPSVRNWLQNWVFMEHRLARIMRKQGISREEAEEIINNVDQMRENYVSKYTGTTRYDTRNSDLVVTIDGKTEDEVVDLILKFIG